VVQSGHLGVLRALRLVRLVVRTAAPVKSGRGLTIVPLLALAVLCWAVVLVAHERRRMGAGCRSGHARVLHRHVDGDDGRDDAAVGVAAVLVYRRLQAARRERGQHAVWMGPAWLLVGYLAAWTMAGLVGFAVLKAGRALDIDALSWDRSARCWPAGDRRGGGLSAHPAQDVCLRHCRGPFSFLLEHWRPGPVGALRMGARHGLWCIGCCWALMAALFALGVMSIPWMAMIALFIGFEKLLPWRRVRHDDSVTVALLALGLAVALVPEQVPG